MYRELPADLETPVSVYLKLARAGAPSFLLESVSGGEQVARYSFIGVDLERAFVVRRDHLEEHSPQGIVSIPLDSTRGPLEALRTQLERHRPQAALPPGLPRFHGGLVGYLGYETIRHIEPSVNLPANDTLPEGIFLLADTLVAFDHAFGRLLLIANQRHTNGDGERDAQASLNALEQRLRTPLPANLTRALNTNHATAPKMHANLTRQQFHAAVLQAKKHIAAGDIFQVVLSQRLSRQTTADPFNIYRTLRRLNPSPYMFFFNFGNLASTQPFHLIGASPEMHVRMENGIAAVRPIAGTRKRGATPEEDRSLEKELLADPKERAEHVMLIDLARNDLGRVCEFGSVRVPELMTIERYSHVMHIVSHVSGKLRPEYNAFDLLAATFPAGTVSGAPKIRAMQIIRDLEGQSRGPYAGVVGYFSYDGSLDTCITIRTLVMHGETISVQAGAGIVADSTPEGEYQETLNKARALAIAVDLAENQ